MITAQTIKQAMQNVLARKNQQQAFQQAVNRTHAAFVQKHPQWAAACFDQHFLTHAAAPLLARVGQGVASVQGYALAVVWSRQMSWNNEKTQQELIAELTPAATEFMVLLEVELHTHETIDEWIPQAA